jgi:type II secretory pathway pseudopilin PulG
MKWFVNAVETCRFMKRRIDSREIAAPRRGAFTLVQMLLVMVLLAVLSAGLFTVMGRGRASAQRAQCDTRLKAIALALDAHRQEYGAYPQGLRALLDKKYLQNTQDLRCPADPTDEGSYEPFYVPRAPRDSAELPTLVCPYHEAWGGGEQVYLGRYVKQFATKPARLTAANGVTVQSPGSSPIAGTVGMALRGADTVRTAANGQAIIEFADGSTATLRGSAQVTILQSFVAGQTQAPLYSIVRQWAGTVSYQIRTGSKFDVATPTATAGALGTRFDITVAQGESGPQMSIFLHEGKVRLTTTKTSALAPLGSLYTVTGSLLNLPDLLQLPGGVLNGVTDGLLGGLGGSGNGGVLGGGGLLP